MSVEFFLFYSVVHKVPTPFLGQKYDFEGLGFVKAIVPFYYPLRKTTKSAYNLKIVLSTTTEVALRTTSKDTKMQQNRN